MILPMRQIHLDFHTFEKIAGIGADFDADRFADTLKRAHVNSVTLFSRCHHGWIYYDTQAFPERRHPYLTRNLLAEQIAACHARGIRVPIYVTVKWDQYSAEAHPEWLARFLEYTGNEQARRIIEKTVDFYPIMVEPSGIVENYTDASWKHSPAWAHPHAPDIVASLTGDRLNKRVANIALERTGGADAGRLGR